VDADGAAGLIATYAVVVIRGDTGAPLWQAQAIFAVVLAAV
jgi:hypothetical protein